MWEWKAALKLSMTAGVHLLGWWFQTIKRRSQSLSALFALPPKIKELVESGLEKSSKHAGGAIGSQTTGKITRTTLYEHAMVAALIPFKNTELFF